MRSLLFFAILFFTFNIQAKLFSNTYISFKLPANWTCIQEGFEYVCANRFNKQKKEALIILTAKQKGPQDSLKTYESFLKNPRRMKNYKFTPYTSKIKVVKKRKISGLDWIDGIHLGSEVKTYYTRYTATIYNSLGILVTFSAHKDHYSKYSNDFIKAIQSLKVIASPELSSLTSNAVKGAKRDLFDTGISDLLPEGISGDLDASDLNNDNNSGGIFSLLGSKGIIGILLLLLTGLGVFIYTRSK